MTFNHTSIGFWITRRAQLTPNRCALDFEDQTFSYAQLNERANRAADALRSAGIAKGDRVAMLCDNRPEYLDVFFACAKIGAVLAPVSWRLAEPEMVWQVEDSDPAALVAAPEWTEAAGRIAGRSKLLSFSDLAKGSIEEPEDLSEFSDPLMILYTSGTTGRPKGAVLTHGNFFWANLNVLVNADINHDDVSLVFLPMFHIGAWNVNTLAVLLKGGTVVLERTFDPRRTLELAGRKDVTVIMGVPATYLFMSQDAAFESADLSSVRLMVVGGAPMPEALLKTYQARGIEIVQGYGLTELAPNALVLPIEDAARKLGAAGKPYFFTDTRLMDEAGQFLESGTGEIVAKGPVVTPGYWRRDDATAEAIMDGWFHTGDVGRVDEEGYFYVVDRKKDMIITGGENVYPAEVENALYEYPAVGEAAVIGIPDEKWGESVHAIVIPSDDVSADQLIAHCKTRLAGFKVPRSIEIRSEPLPRTPAGKVRKTELRAPFWEEQGKKI